MILNMNIGTHVFSFSHTRMVDVVGVNSKLKDGKHFLMWDFDNVALTDVLETLRIQQMEFCLPDIHVLETGTPAHFHAYCLARVEFMSAAEILCGTMWIDPTFFRMGCCRGFWTLRLSSKNGVVPTHVTTLSSNVQEEVDVHEIASLVAYRTKKDKTKEQIVINIGGGGT